MRQIIKETIDKVTLAPKQFSLQLKRLENSCGGRFYLNLQDDERLAMHDLIESIIEDDSISDETQYNIFRLARYVIRIDQKFKQNFETYLKRYLRTVFHPYGNIRVAGRKLVNHIRFGISLLTVSDELNQITEKEAKENRAIMYPLIGDVFMDLQSAEFHYQKDHSNTLDPKDLYNGQEFIYPEETKDKFLKSIRKGMEARDVGNMDKIMEYCGYVPLYKPDGIRFRGGRYAPKEFMNRFFEAEDKMKNRTNDKSTKAEIRQKIHQERKEIEKALEIFLSSNKLNFSVEYIKNMIYNRDQNLMVENGSKKYMQFWMDIFDEHDIDFSQNLLDLLTACRNYFPHKTLGGKCPEEAINGL